MTRICVPFITTLLVRKAAWAFTSAEIAKGHTPKPYGVKYDMESLLYVVLYDAILYLRHNQDAYIVRRTISHMFDFQGSESGEPMGGVGKEHNMTERRYTRDYRWNSVLDNWLNTMMNYMFPLREFGGQMDGIERWTPENVNAFWSKLLEGPVVDGDRTSLFPDLREDASQYLSGPPFEATFTAPPPTVLTKRTYDKMADVIKGLNLATATQPSAHRAASDDPPPAKKGRTGGVRSSAPNAATARLIAGPSTSSITRSPEPLPPAVTLSSASRYPSHASQSSGEADREHYSTFCASFYRLLESCNDPLTRLQYTCSNSRRMTLGSERRLVTFTSPSGQHTELDPVRSTIFITTRFCT
ncbi:hypothetical protein C8Q74DRAFT_881282 [Fomes fomentarius]|nr:hypothetical protein C8Q74DRAFT_881282 [Fomes fomentarius]